MRKSIHINIIVSFMYQILMIVFGFIIPRLFLANYGPMIHGLTSTITNIMSYVMLLNAGLNAASTFALYKPIADNDHIKLSQTLVAIKKYYYNTGVIFFVIVIVISLILPVFVDNIPYLTVFLLMVVMGLQSVLTSFLISTHRVLLLADQKLYINNIINIITLILRGFIQVFLIHIKAPVFIVQFIPTVIILLAFLIQQSYIKINYPQIDNTASGKNIILTSRKSAFIHQIAGLVVNNTDVLILTMVTRDMILVSIYSVYQLVFSHLYSFFTSVFLQGTVAKFGNLMALKNKMDLNNKYNLYEFFYYSLISVIYSVTAVMILPFVNLYTMGTQGVNYGDSYLSILFIIIGVLNNLRVPGLTLINAGGYYKETQRSAIFEAIINIFMSMILVNIYGIYGLLIGTLISFLYRTNDIILFSNNKILDKSAKTTYFRVFRVIVIILISLSINFVMNIQVSSWTNWIWKAVITTLNATTITIIINSLFDRESLIRLYKHLLKIVKNKRL